MIDGVTSAPSTPKILSFVTVDVVSSKGWPVRTLYSTSCCLFTISLFLFFSIIWLTKAEL